MSECIKTLNVGVTSCSQSTREHAVQACERKKNPVVGKIRASSMLYYHKLSSNKGVNNDEITRYSEQIVFRSHYVQTTKNVFRLERD